MYPGVTAGGFLQQKGQSNNLMVHCTNEMLISAKFSNFIISSIFVESFQGSMYLCPPPFNVVFVSNNHTYST